MQDGNAEKIKRSGDEVSEGNKILSREQNQSSFMHLKNLSETKFESDEPGLGWRNFKTRQYSGGIGVTAHRPYPVCSERNKGSRRT